MHNFKRTDRVAELLRREISVIIDQELRDERIHMTTVTGVDVARDLKSARVYVSILGSDDDVRQTVEGLNSAANFIRSLLAERIVLRYMPALTFQYDASTVQGMHMDKLLDEIKKNREG